MDNKLLEEIKSKLINILPTESEIDTGFYGVKFYRRNNAKILILAYNAHALFLLQMEKSILI